MKSIVYQDRSSGAMFIYNPQQIKFDIIKYHDRIMQALTELKHVGNINIYLYKKRKLHLISSHN